MSLNIIHILRELKSRNVTLDIQEGNLKINAPKNGLSSELYSTLKDHKSEIIEYLKSVQRNTPAKDIPLAAQSDIYVLSSSQRQLWMNDQIGDSGNAYNITGCYELRGGLDARRLIESIGFLVDRHEILRTTFLSQEGIPYQKLHSRASIGFQVEYSDLSNSSTLPSMEDLVEEERELVFDLSRGPLVSARLIRLPDNRYVLVMTFHHIICDGWSVDVLVLDLLRLYRGDSISPLRIQYKDYSVWQQGRLGGSDYESARRYWHDQFSEGIPLLDLPTVHSRPKERVYEGSVRRYGLGATLSEALRSGSRQQGVSLFMLMLSILKGILYRYTGQEDIVIGTALAGRSERELENQVGFYVNTIALRTPLSGGWSFSRLVEEVKRVVLDGSRHECYPFDVLVEELNVLRDPGRHPVFDVMAVMQNTSVEASMNQQLEGVEVIRHDLDWRVSKFDLTVNFFDTPDELVVELEYSSVLYDEVWVDHFLSHYQRFAAGVMRDMQVSLNAVEYLDEGDLLLLNEFNKTETPYENEQTIHGLFERGLLTWPDRVAVVSGEKHVSYRELNIRSNQFAHYLREACGVGRGSVVGVMVEKSDCLLVALFGILKAGGCYVPIGSDLPVYRIEEMLRSSGASVLVSAQDPAGVSIPVKVIGTNYDLYSFYSQENPPRISSSDDLAYVIYTSGTTGTPKGAGISHGSVVNLAGWLNGFYQGDGIKTALLTANISFDASVQQLFTPLLYGHRLILMREEEKKDIHAYIGHLIRHEVHILDITPSYLSAVLSALQAEDVIPLECVLVGGEALVHDLVSRYKSRFPQSKLVNVYGVTEATVDSTYEEADVVGHSTGIGKPIHNTQIYILDRVGNVQPPEVWGEIVIGGVGVGKGYVGMKDLTEERFVTNPFCSGEKMYRTGDIGRWLRDGTLEFRGRRDTQLKLRGYRIEAGEIEQWVQSYAGISNAAVLLHGSGEDGYLVCYYMSDAPVKESEVKRHLAQRLPSYMIPSQYIHMQTFPLNASGKTDRKKLPPPEGDAEIEQYVPPSTAIEEQLCTIWCSVLGHDRIGIRDNFFALGGHSLKAIRIVSLVRKEMNATVSLKDIFVHPTVEGMAKGLVKNTTLFTPIPVSAPADHFELSIPQRNLWMLSQLDTTGSAYNLLGCFELHGSLDEVGFARAFDLLVARHEILRTSFVMIKNEPKQKINSPELSGFSMKTLDWRDERKLDQRLKELREKERLQVFDLNKGPLLSAILVKVSSNEYRFLLTMHHLISDGWSVDVILGDLVRLYSGSALPPLSIQYKDYAKWQLETQGEKEYHDSKKYWISRFSDDVASLEIPTRFKRTQSKTVNGKTFHYEFGKETSKRLRQFSKQNDCSLFITALAIVKVLFYRYTGQNDITVGTAIAGRNHKDLENQVGFYVNTLPLRTRVSGELSFVDLVREVRRTCLDAYEHGQYPFEELINELHINRDMSRNPLFDVLVEMQNASEMSTTLLKQFDGVRIDEVYDDAVASKYDLMINFSGSGDVVSVDIEYNADLFDEEWIERFSNHCNNVSLSVAADSNIKLSQINYLQPAERHELLTVFNSTEMVCPQHQTIHGLFELQVAKTPDAIALIYKDRKLSYRQLNEEADKLARYLTTEGRVNQGEFVAIMLDKSDYMIIGLLGILKAGGAYVPIDPSYPATRKDLILQETAPKVLITETDHLFNIDVQGVMLFAIDLQLSGWAYTGSDPLAPVSADLPAYIIYTSGSTGRPKGVVIQHKSICNTLFWRKAYYDFKERDVNLQFPSFAFDSSVEDIFSILMCGGTLLMPVDEQRTDPFYLRSLIAEHHVSHFLIVPSLYNVLLEHLDVATSLRAVTVAGEAIKNDLVKRHFNRLPAVRLINEYGPTENSVCSTAVELDVTQDVITIGKGIGNVRLYVLDEMLDLLPVGMAGEICVSGPGLAAGYWKNEELTAEKFIDNPYADHVHTQKLYRTGDIGRWLPDGTIEFLGRKDNQVKIRGYRVELGEIENAIADYPAVVDVAVELKSGSLVAYMVVSEALTRERIRQYLIGSLPEYMIPSTYVFLARLPLNSNGKVDRNALPEPVIVSDNYIPPTTHEEKLIVDAWIDVLGQTDIGLDDDFFAMGGDSIKAIQVCSKIGNAGYKLSVVDVFLHKTPRALAHIVRPLEREISQQMVSGYVPLTPIQVDFFRSTPIDMHHYNQSVILYRREEFNEDILCKVLAKINEHHDALRTRFRKEGDLLVQTIRDLDRPIELTVYDLTEVGSAESEVLSIVSRVQSTIDLEHGPLMKCVIIKLSDGDRLAIVVHHLVVDGISWRILLEDIDTLYNQVLGGVAPSLPMKTDSYKVWAEHLQAHASSVRLKEELEFWKSLGNSSSLLSKESGSMPNLVGDAVAASVLLDGHDTELLLTAANKPFNTNVHELILTALGLSLKHAFGLDHVAIMLESYGRDHPFPDIDVTRTVGWFTADYPVILNMEFSGDLAREIKEIKESVRKVPSKGLGYGILKNLSSSSFSEISCTPEIIFNYMGQVDSDLSNRCFTIAKEIPRDQVSSRRSREAVIEVSAMVIHKQLDITIEYNRLHFDREFIEELTQDFRRQLETVTAFCVGIDEKQLSPSDLGYSTLSIEEVENFFD